MKIYILTDSEEVMTTDSDLVTLWQTAIANNFASETVAEFDALVRERFGAAARMLGSES